MANTISSTTRKKLNELTGTECIPLSDKTHIVAKDIKDISDKIDKKVDIPEGGTTGQVLVKNADGIGWGTPSSSDNDLSLATEAEVAAIFNT